MKWVLFSVALLATGVFLVRVKFTAAVLRSELAQQRLAHEDLEAQRRERARLLRLQPTRDELDRLQRAVAERAELRRAIDAAEHERRDERSSGLAVGEWFPPNQWQDRGHRTPAATVQTMLWAAAGGDTARLQRLFHLDEDARAKLGQVHSALTTGARGAYASPVQLIAAFTAKAIPVGDAQLVWQHQSGPDEAVACVWINNPFAPSQPETPAKANLDINAPPMLPANPKRSQAVLTMRRFDDGWRVVVPMHAIEKLARDLGARK